MSEEKEFKLTEEQMSLIFKGIRPDDISKELFDILRRDRDAYMRKYKKGILIHNSNNGTYVKKK